PFGVGVRHCVDPGRNDLLDLFFAYAAGDLNTALEAVNLFQRDPADSTGAKITFECPFQASVEPLLAARTRVGCSLSRAGTITSPYVGKCFVEKDLAALAVTLGENLGTPFLRSAHSRSPVYLDCMPASSVFPRIAGERLDSTMSL